MPLPDSEGTMPRMDPIDFVGAFERITRAYQAARKIALGASGLSPEQLSILSEANRRPGTPVDAIASALSMTASAATKAVKQLVRMGLLAGDGGRVEPTEKGHAIGVRATEQVWTGFAQALGGAGAIANAVAGLITSATSVLDRWVERNMPQPEKPQAKERKRRSQ